MTSDQNSHGKSNPYEPVHGEPSLQNGSVIMPVVWSWLVGSLVGYLLLPTSTPFWHVVIMTLLAGASAGALVQTILWLNERRRISSRG